MANGSGAAVVRRDEIEQADEVIRHEGGGAFDMARVEDPTRAMMVADELVTYMAKKCQGPRYIASIQGKNYPKVEWWTTVGASLGLFPREESNVRLDRDDEVAYEATVAVYRGDQPVTRASAICSDKERSWSNRDEYAIRSMAATRATGKAFRLGLSFLATLAGLEATPAEEVPHDGFRDDHEFDLDNKVGWGKHADLTWRELAEQEPGYIKWAKENTDKITDDMLEELRSVVRPPKPTLPDVDGEHSLAALEDMAGVGTNDRAAICKRLGFESPVHDPDAYADELRRIIAERQEQEA